MRLYNRWTPMRGSPPTTVISPSQGVVYGPDREPYGVVSTTVKRLSWATYKVVTIRYKMRELAVTVDSGIEFNLRDARARGERGFRQGHGELYAASRQEVES